MGLGDNSLIGVRHFVKQVHIYSLQSHYVDCLWYLLRCCILVCLSHLVIMLVAADLILQFDLIIWRYRWVVRVVYWSRPKHALNGYQGWLVHALCRSWFRLPREISDIHNFRILVGYYFGLLGFLGILRIFWNTRLCWFIWFQGVSSDALCWFDIIICKDLSLTYLGVGIRLWMLWACILSFWFWLAILAEADSTCRHLGWNEVGCSFSWE